MQTLDRVYSNFANSLKSPQTRSKYDIINISSTDVEQEQKPEVKIKAITELHAIEVTLIPNVEAATKSLCE